MHKEGKCGTWTQRNFIQTYKIDEIMTGAGKQMQLEIIMFK